MPDGASFSAYGLSVVLNDCCKVVKRDALFHLDFVDASGTVIKSDERHVKGADACPRGLPNPTMDPCQ